MNRQLSQRRVRLVIAWGRLRSVEHGRRRMSLNQLLRNARSTWHGVKLNQPELTGKAHCVMKGPQTMIIFDRMMTRWL